MLVVSNAAAHLSQVTSAAVFGHIDMQHIVAVINESTNRQVIIIEAASRTRNLIDFFVNALIGGSCFGSLFRFLRFRYRRGVYIFFRCSSDSSFIGFNGSGIQHFIFVHGICLLCIKKEI